MKNNEKFMSDQEFADNGIKYLFTIYPSRAHYEHGKPVAAALPWENNDLTRHTAQLILMGMAAGASAKYKNPFAVLYGITPNGIRQPLSTCQY